MTNHEQSAAETRLSRLTSALVETGAAKIARITAERSWSSSLPSPSTSPGRGVCVARGALVTVWVTVSVGVGVVVGNWRVGLALGCIVCGGDNAGVGVGVGEGVAVGASPWQVWIAAIASRSKPLELPGTMRLPESGMALPGSVMRT